MPVKNPDAAVNWPPADQYPVMVEGDGAVGAAGVTTTGLRVELVDFGKTITLGATDNYVAEAERVIKALLRERAAKGLMMPFPSSIESLKDRDGFVAMIPTKGWNEIKEEDQPE